MDTHNDSKIAIIVLGDIGRSPRMQYHAMSFAQTKKVSIVCYEGERCVQVVRENQNITIFAIQPISGMLWLRKALFPLYAVVKVVLLLFRLLLTLLFKIPKPDIMLMQNPPSIPTMAIVWLVCKIRGAHMVIDWHNLGYTVLGYSLGTQHPLVKLSKVYEQFFARLGSGHLCVTKTMAEWLKVKFKITAVVLHDKPPRFFQPTSKDERQDLFQRLIQKIKHQQCKGSQLIEKCLTEPAETQPFLLVSSTSWSEDEDFSLLLGALLKMDGTLPRDVVVCVTGKGTQKAGYEAQIAKMQLKQIEIHTLWLDPEDYPKLLGCSDLGVCLHKSTSGLDLPMKVVDMFGCGIPVCAVSFGCLHELVQHGKNGLVFQTSEELAVQIQELLSHDAEALCSLKKNVDSQVRWEENWEINCIPFFSALLQKPAISCINAANFILCVTYTLAFCFLIVCSKYLARA